jgi:uncharacterized protein YndB with AHSA1/START domain
MAIKELTITRTFDVPRKFVWKAWTDQEIVKQWWGPRGVTNPTCEWDAMPNGKINIVMLAGKELGSFAGRKWPITGTFKQVTPETRLVFTSSGNDGDVGKIDSEVIVDFEDLGDSTKMNVQIVVTRADKAEMMIQGMEAGWNQQFDKLSETLEKMKS